MTIHGEDAIDRSPPRHRACVCRQSGRRAVAVTPSSRAVRTVTRASRSVACTARVHASTPAPSSREPRDEAAVSVRWSGRGWRHCDTRCYLLYALGGYDGRSVSSCEVYDPASNSWRAIAPMGSKRQCLAAAVVGGLLYALGGYDGSSVWSSCEVYDPASNSWRAIAPMGSKRQFLAAAVVSIG